MQPYNTDNGRMIEIEDVDEQPLTDEQLAKTWFHRIKEDAIRIEMLNDLPF